MGTTQHNQSTQPLAASHFAHFEESAVNPIIIVAIIAQSFISKASRMAGAVVGFIVTTGILLWGISLYGGGSGIALLGIPLSETVFIAVCIAWYGFNTRALLRARAFEKQTAQPKPSGASSAL